MYHIQMTVSNVCIAIGSIAGFIMTANIFDPDQAKKLCILLTILIIILALQAKILYDNDHKGYGGCTIFAGILATVAIVAIVSQTWIKVLYDQDAQINTLRNFWIGCLIISLLCALYFGNEWRKASVSS